MMDKQHGPTDVYYTAREHEEINGSVRFDVGGRPFQRHRTWPTNVLSHIDQLTCNTVLNKLKWVFTVATLVRNFWSMLSPVIKSAVYSLTWADFIHRPAGLDWVVPILKFCHPCLIVGLTPSSSIDTSVRFRTNVQAAMVLGEALPQMISFSSPAFHTVPGSGVDGAKAASAIEFSVDARIKPPSSQLFIFPRI